LLAVPLGKGDLQLDGLLDQFRARRCAQLFIELGDGDGGVGRDVAPEDVLLAARVRSIPAAATQGITMNVPAYEWR